MHYGNRNVNVKLHGALDFRTAPCQPGDIYYTFCRNLASADKEGESRLADLRRTLLTAAILVAIACLTALAHNALRVEGIPWIRPDANAVAEDNGPILSLARAKALFDEGVVFVDSRTQEEYAEGHIQGARLLYYEHAAENWEKAMAGVPFDKTVVAYCSGEGCNSSYLVAEHLRDMGFEEVLVFHGGWPAWLAASYPAGGRDPHIKLFEFGR